MRLFKQGFDCSQVIYDPKVELTKIILRSTFWQLTLQQGDQIVLCLEMP